MQHKPSKNQTMSSYINYQQHDHLTKHLTYPPRPVVTTCRERFQRGLPKIPLLGRQRWLPSLCHFLSTFACLPLARQILDHSAQFHSGKFKLVFFSSISSTWPATLAEYMGLRRLTFLNLENILNFYLCKISNCLFICATNIYSRS